MSATGLAARDPDRPSDPPRVRARASRRAADTVAKVTDQGPEPVEVLRRWEASGAVWEVLAESGQELTIALLTCDAGEEMGRVQSADPDLKAYVGDRRRSDDAGHT
jgi:hypothetical protein